MMTKECEEALQLVFQDKIQKLVLSNLRTKESLYKRITAVRLEDGFQVEKFTEKQAFHEKVSDTRMEAFCGALLEQDFGQLNAWSESREHSIRISKKGKVLYQSKRTTQPVKIVAGHNREKQYLLREGTAILPLVDMGVFTKEGKVVRSMYDKFRQINKFVEFIDEAVDKSGLDRVNIIDFGCGKSYLTFVVYYYLVYVKKIAVTMTGLDLKADVIAKCNATAKKYGYDQLHFEVGDINGYESDVQVDMVISLHACDQATDFALYNAIRWNARMIISVPCCQHELCGQLSSEELAIVQRYGIIKERMAALMTDAIRGNLLEACGYKTQIMEFVDLSHTPKNLLIRAVKSNITAKHKRVMLEEVQAMCKTFQVQPTLLKLLQQDGLLE